MARLKDVIPTIRAVGPIRFLLRIWTKIGTNNLLTWASALAYAWLFAIFPFFLFLMTLIPYLPAQWKHDSKDWICGVVYQLPKQGAWTIWSNIEPHIDKLLNARVSSLSIIGALLTLWAASGGVNATMAALNQVYQVTKARPFYKQRPLAAGVTLAEVLLILSVLVLIPLGTIATHWAEERVAETVARVREFTASSKPSTNPATAPASSDATPAAPADEPSAVVRHFVPLLAIWQIARHAIGLFLLLTAVALIYHFGPNIRQPWRWITPGAVFCVGVWILLGALFRFYIDRFGKYDQTYGTVGGVVIILLFFYVDAAVLLIGAQINSEIDFVSLNIQPGATDFRGEPWKHNPLSASESPPATNPMEA